MSQNDPKTIELYGYGIQREGEASATIKPGMLVERNAGKIRPHDDAGNPANPTFAVEMGMAGMSIDDEYEADDQVIFKTYAAGSGVYALIGNGEDVSVDDLLTSNGDGRLKVAGDDDNIVAQALEAANTEGAATEARCRVEVFMTGIKSTA